SLYICSVMEIKQRKRMKTFEEHLQDAVGAKYPLQDILENLSAEEILEEVNIFSKGVAREALKNAMIKQDEVLERFAYRTHGPFAESLRESILDDKNIPEL